MAMMARAGLAVMIVRASVIVFAMVLADLLRVFQDARA